MDVRHLVEGFSGCVAYGPRHGLHSLGTAQAALQAHRERRARESMDPMVLVAAQPPAVQAPALPSLPSADRSTAEAAARWLLFGDAPALPPVAAPVLPPVAPARPMLVPHVHIPELCQPSASSPASCSRCLSPRMACFPGSAANGIGSEISMCNGSSPQRSPAQVGTCVLLIEVRVSPTVAERGIPFGIHLGIGGRP